MYEIQPDSIQFRCPNCDAILRDVPSGAATVERAVTVAETARLLGLSTDSIYRLARGGEIPGFKVAGVWRFYPSSVRAHLERPRDPWAQSERSRQPRRSTRVERAQARKDGSARVSLALALIDAAKEKGLEVSSDEIVEITHRVHP